MVEGWLFKAKGNDPLDRRVKVLQDAGCRKPENRKTLRLQECITALIPQWPVAHVMGLAVDLDGNPPLQTGEIQNQFTERMVPPELESAGALAQFPPDQRFGKIAAAAFAFGDFERRFGCG